MTCFNMIYFTLNNNLKENIYNVRTGIDFSIKELAEIIRDRRVGHKDEIDF